jgi:hypothetical protein
MVAFFRTGSCAVRRSVTFFVTGYAAPSFHWVRGKTTCQPETVAVQCPRKQLTSDVIHAPRLRPYSSIRIEVHVGIRVWEAQGATAAVDGVHKDGVARVQAPSRLRVTEHRVRRVQTCTQRTTVLQ